MNPNKIEIAFGELRATYVHVISFTKKEAPWCKIVNSNTEVENDLELIGLDNEDFFEAFSNEFKVDFGAMKYNDYFDPEKEAELESVFHFFVLFPFFLLKTILFILFWPFSRKFSSIIAAYSYIQNQPTAKKDVTIGDLVVSVILKRFAERNDFEIALKQ